ncbi:MAG: cysteine desulfurase [Firmicutes bacterium]|nr:cysteine desulfurase [Bacillota bacterium]MBV1727446.1 cysteine desulfurase [Desulforudis sp.]MBU4532920.1 cysteine desulfurase [Bacillota bacterium]MBU4555042.1 cysteine desulfurase [Bacillota bacterium]MBV1734492.1 cysteine desulfurase [Desulforudis sp.]
MRTIYLDHGATTAPDPLVIEEMIPYLKNRYGNPSSGHHLGRQARAGVEIARQRLAGALGAGSQEIVFTSGGSEADYLAIRGTIRALGKRQGHIIISAFEHHAVLDTCLALERKGFTLSLVSIGEDGIIDPVAVQREIRPETFLLSVMHANNEIGTVQPVREIATLAHKHGILVHTDSVQSFGKIAVDVNELGVDLLTVSSHKIHGPKGAGALYIREGTPWEPVNFGGGQEGARRPGTENVPGVIGLGAAAEMAVRQLKDASEKILMMRERLVDGVLNSIPGSRLNGDRAKRIPGNAHFSFEGVLSRSLLEALDQQGICASGASACASGSCQASHVLTAIGLPLSLALSAVRFTLGKENTAEELDFTLEILRDVVDRIRRANTR